ncbi:MAG: DUF2142 domain-containing protein [Chloroflexota bacterium]|nr:glycosyltransferase family 39 protein [Chloroflexota bacterium]
MVRHWPFLVVLILYVGLAFAYSRATPMWETPDEPSHFAYARYIQINGGPPIQSFQEGKNEVETGHHPLLYYYLGRLLLGETNLADFKKLQHNPYFSFNNNDGGVNVFSHQEENLTMPNSIAAGYTLRNLSIIFGAGTLLLTYLSGLLIFGPTGAGERWLWASRGRTPATLAAVFVGLLPQFGFLSGAINNDNGIVFFCSLSLYGCLWLILRPHPVTSSFSLLGGIVGLGMLTKYNEIAYIPLVALAIGVVAVRARSWWLFLKGGLISGGVCLAISGWWFVRSQILYGDPAGWGMWRSSFASVDQSSSFKWNRSNLEHIWSRWFDSFWGVFGWMNIRFEPELYAWPARVMIVAAIGLTLLTLAASWSFIRQRRENRSNYSLQSHALSQTEDKPEKLEKAITENLEPKPPDRTTLSLIFLALSVGLVLISALNYAATFGDAGTQGRYLFPMLSAFALGSAAGLTWLPGLLRYVIPRRWTILSQVVVGGLAWLLVSGAGFSLGYLNLYALNDKIIPAYTIPTNLSLNALPSGATPIQGAEFAPGMWLAGYEVTAPPANLKVGQTASVKLTLYWFAKNSMKENWIGFVHLYAAGQDIGQQDGTPGQGRYQTFFWKKGEIVKDERLIPVKSENWNSVIIEKQPLRLQLGWYNGGNRAQLNNGNVDFYFDWNR